MENHNKRVGYPKTAYELFLKLYCRKIRISSDKNNITLLAAVKAWITLKEDEKKMFIEKFIQCKEKHKNQLALRLEKIKPYMKKKQIKRLPENDKSESLLTFGNVDSSEEGPPSTHGFNELAASTNNLNYTFSEKSSIEDQQTNTKFENLEEYESPVLSEPLTPNVRNSIDLFNIIKKKKGDSNLEWAFLTKVEKMRYRKAVFQLKKDYIQNYKMYLESLPSKVLFKYYHNYGELEIS